MKKKYISKILIITAIFLVIGSSVVVAKLIPDEEIFTDFFDNGYYHKLLSKGLNDKAAQAEIDRLRNQVLERQAAIEARKRMTPQEIAAGEKQLNDFTNELGRQQALHPSPNPEPQLGIFEKDQVIFGPEDNIKKFIFINFWGGKLNNTDKENARVYAGGDRNNISQGQVLIYNEQNIHGKFYPTPTATGPVRIISEKDGILTLKSVGGTYEQSVDHGAAPSKQITVKGGATYYFNIRTRLFK